jgi:deoxyribonuclease V
MQVRLASTVCADVPDGFAPRTVAGVDVAYGDDGRLAAAVAVLDVSTLDEVASATAVGTAEFPYVSGLFAFRELPVLLDALNELAEPPDLLVVDGQGLAHPRRFGLACHLGVLTGIPTIGVAKTPLGAYDPPGPDRGATAELRDRGEVVGVALRTQRDVKPVFVSIGHRIDLPTACAHVLALAPRYRLPETTRRADRRSRDALDAG